MYVTFENKLGIIMCNAMINRADSNAVHSLQNNTNVCMQRDHGIEDRCTNWAAERSVLISGVKRSFRIVLGVGDWYLCLLLLHFWKTCDLKKNEDNWFDQLSTVCIESIIVLHSNTASFIPKSLHNYAPNKYSKSWQCKQLLIKC